MLRQLEVPPSDLPLVVAPRGSPLRNSDGYVVLGLAGASEHAGSEVCDLLVVGAGRIVHLTTAAVERCQSLICRPLAPTTEVLEARLWRQAARPACVPPSCVSGIDVAVKS